MEYSRSLLFHFILDWSRIFHNVTKYSKVFKILKNIFEYFGIFWNILEYSGIFWNNWKVVPERYCSAVIQVKQSNPKCQVCSLLPYSNQVGLDKKLSNNPETVSINLGTWPMSNEALIAYQLISKQHCNHAKTRVQFDLTIRIGYTSTREGGGCLDCGLME